MHVDNFVVEKTYQMGIKLFRSLPFQLFKQLVKNSLISHLPKII